MAGGEAFAPLLNYMYTGRLEVTLDNVYSVLLATHLLHMPGALEQCRAALLRLRAPPALPIPVPTSTATTTSPPGNILRPIPSRLLVGPSLCWPPTTPLYPPTAPGSMSHLPQIPPSVLMQPTVSPVAARDNKQEQCAHYRFAVRVFENWPFNYFPISLLLSRTQLLQPVLMLPRDTSATRFSLISCTDIE